MNLKKPVDLGLFVSLYSIDMITPSGECPVCAATVALQADTQATEIVTCADCKTKLVVDGINGGAATLSQAPAVEEDWGE